MAPSAQQYFPDASALISAKLSNMLIPDYYYAYDLSYLAPVDRLPVELLIDIFLACARDADGSPLAPLLLSHVCRSWRDIVLACPRIWQFLSLTSSRSHDSVEYLSLLWLKHSKLLPLDVRLDVSDVDSLIPLMVPLFPHLHRWRRWHLAGKVSEDVDFPSFSTDGSRPILDDMQINIRGIAELQDMQRHEPSSRHPIFSSSQSFLKPEVHMVCVRLDVLSLPPSPSMSAISLRNLTIQESSLEVVSDPVRMLEFLQFCPSIETFHYTGFPQEPPLYSEPPARPSVVLLPRLRVLVVRSTCAVRIILSHITAPSLSELYLEHTNVEAEADVETYPYDAEDGDSDDENQDFSQSPWSDHATGMGLRSLISRSNPPLEVLAMDYADMRTKDFEWCFDRMELLQEFRIVASDMSDKVIAMLAPFEDGMSPVCTPFRAFRVDHHPSEDASGSDSESASSSGSYASATHFRSPLSRSASKFAPHIPMHVRMPRLSSLKLWNCQRLTGDAIVHALRARTRYTDEAATEGGLAGPFVQMEEVAVIGCSDFYPRHALDMGFVLGNRFRFN